MYPLKSRLSLVTVDVPLVVQVDFEDFTEKLGRHELPGGLFYQVRGVPDAAGASRQMDEVRQYRI